MIENIDDNMGLLMGKLADWQALENTLVDLGADIQRGAVAAALAQGE